MGMPDTPSGYKAESRYFYNDDEDSELNIDTAEEGGIFDQLLLDDLVERSKAVVEAVKNILPAGAINIWVNNVEYDYISVAYHRPFTEKEKQDKLKAEEARKKKALANAQKKKLKDLQDFKALVKANPDFVEKVRDGKI